MSGEGRGQASFFESHWWWCLGPPKTSRGWCEDTGKGLNNLFPDVQFEIVAGVRREENGGYKTKVMPGNHRVRGGGDSEP